MATQIFPLEVWTSQITQASVPANENSLRVEVLNRGALSIESTQPATPTEGDIHILGSSPTGAQWSSFTANNVVIYTGGTWLEFEAFLGWVKAVGIDVYEFDGTTWNLFAVGPSSEPWTYIRLTADFANSVSTFADATGLSFAASSGKIYEVQIFGAWQTTATTSGLAMKLTGPAASGFIGKIEHFTSTTAPSGVWQNSDTTPTVTTTGATSANDNQVVSGRWLVSTTEAGTIQLQVRPETNGQTATLKGGMFIMQYREIP